MTTSGACRGVLLLLAAALLPFCKSTASRESAREKEPASKTAPIKIKDNQKASATPLKLPRPNVVVMVLDTLRPDYLGLYGAKEEIAPFLGKLAKQSVVFENALSSSSWTAPSTASIFTGLYPPEHTVTQGFRAHRYWIEKMSKGEDASFELNRMPLDMKTLPELFQQAGYATFGLASNINIGESMGFSRGFDRFDLDIKAPAEDLYKKTSKWWTDIAGGKPFFLYIHFNDPHVPYNKRKPHYTYSSDPQEDARARYRSEISYLDGYVSKVWDLPGIRDNTALVVVSDHGEEFWEHGDTEHGPKLYAEINRVVMMMHGPSAGLKPKRVAENVSLVDIVPTLSALIGVELDEAREGMSLLPLLTESKVASAFRDQLRERCLFGHRMFSSIRKVALWSITCGHLKLIDWWGERRELFDHTTDPGDLNDIAETRAKTADLLSTRLDTFKKRMKARARSSETTDVPLDNALVERLRTLGYVE